MIVEGLVTSLDATGLVNIAPMGPVVLGDFERLLLRPFQASNTFSNLAATRCGVFHVVDRVDIIARAAIGRLDSLPETEPAKRILGAVLVDCCRWFEFTVDGVDATEPRSRMPCTVIHTAERRPFFGFNRARHAILEAAIIATRLHLLPESQVASTFQFIEPAVTKTGDESERDLFDMLKQFVHSRRERSA